MAVGTDPAEWIINDSTIDFLLSKEIDQNLNENFSKMKTFYPGIDKFRSLTRSMFQRKMQNGQKIDRKHLCYSSSKKALFCIPCRLFGNGSSKLGTEGYKDWSNIKLWIAMKDPQNISKVVKILARKKMIGRIDTGLQMQIEKI